MRSVSPTAAHPTYPYEGYRMLNALVNDLSKTKICELDGSSGCEQHWWKNVNYQLLVQYPTSVDIMYHFTG
jgi:hypothetical protein